MGDGGDQEPMIENSPFLSTGLNLDSRGSDPTASSSTFFKNTTASKVTQIDILSWPTTHF